MSFALRSLLVLGLVVVFVSGASIGLAGKGDDQVEALFKLNKLRDLGLVDEVEYQHKRGILLDTYLGLRATAQAPTVVTLKNAAPITAMGNSSGYNINITITPSVQWLIDIFDQSMPKSYEDTMPTNGRSFWHSEKYFKVGAIDPWGNKLALDDRVAIQERTLTNKGLNLYDAAVWCIALSLSGLGQLVDSYYRQVLYPSSTGSNPLVDGLTGLRANNKYYLYGAKKIPGDQLASIKLPGNMTQIVLEDPTCCGECCAQKALHSIPGGFYYRMIGPTYRLADPLMGSYGYQWKYPYPDNDTTTPWNLAGISHWNDWKPITGENVWGGILGPLQTMWLKNCSQILPFTTFDNAPAEVQQAISMLPALEAMQSPLGALYHCPDGTKMFPPDPDEKTNVSNENNFSAYASLAAFKWVLDNFASGATDPVLIKASATVDHLIQGIESWFAKYLLSTEPIDDEYVIYQGGHITFDGTFTPQGGFQSFAVDCQTWGMTVLGQKYFDAHYGADRAYSVWKATKKLAGYYINGELAGVGYTTSGNWSANTTNDIWSGEWTFGAINMVRKVANEYLVAGRQDYHDELMADYKSMLKWISTPYVWGRDGTWVPGGGLVGPDGGYLYANERFFIPWGWYANPIGATSSTGWSVMVDYVFNPFQLGGGNYTTFYTQKCPGVKNQSPVFSQTAPQ